MKKKIGFIADGNAQIGLGHIMRCIALGKIFAEMGHKIYFFSIYEEGIRKIQEHGFNLVEELKDFDIIIIDKYDLTQNYFIDIKQHTNYLGYIDDVNAFEYPVDFLINGSLMANELSYRKNKGKLFMLGLKYNILREEFHGLPKAVIKEKIENIMITTGGSDPFRTTNRLTEFIRSCSKYDETYLHIVIGSSFLDADQLKKQLSQYKKIVTYENVKRMSEIMLKCDIAFSAGGGTIYELCACGTPTIGFVLADNQRLVVNHMDELGYIKSIGWYHEFTRNNVISTLDMLAENVEIRKRNSEKQQSLVDGRGAKRIADTILSYIEKDINYKRM